MGSALLSRCHNLLYMDNHEGSTSATNFVRSISEARVEMLGEGGLRENNGGG